MPYGFVRILSSFFFFFFFLVFYSSAAKMVSVMIILLTAKPDRSRHFNRSHIMVIGRSVYVFRPRATPGWGRGAPQTPQNPPPPPRKMQIFVCNAFQNPRNFFFFCVLRPQEHFLATFFFSVKNSTLPTPPPPPPARPRPVTQNTHPNHSVQYSK